MFLQRFLFVFNGMYTDKDLETNLLAELRHSERIMLYNNDCATAGQTFLVYTTSTWQVLNIELNLFCNNTFKLQNIIQV